MSGKKLDQLKLTKTPTWINQDNIEKLKSADFQRFVRFFVINTPDKITSARGKEVSEYGYTDEEVLLEELLDGIPCVAKKSNIEKKDLTDSALINFPPSVLDERVCFAVSNNKPVTSLFIKIRDSLAHGRFNFGGSIKISYLIMEDINTNLNCSARLILKFTTLRQWIDKLEG